MLRSIVPVVLVLFASLCHGSVFSRTHREQSGKIVGGEDIDIADAPYQISLFREKSGHSCGGSIISKTLILTAAHCVASSIGKFQVRAGSSSIYKGGQIIDVESYKAHEKFDFLTMDYDIAILKLSKPLTFNRFVSQIKVIGCNYTIADGAEATVTGWGTTQEGGAITDDLKRVTIPIVNQKECQDAYSGFQPVTDRMICAGITQGGKDACQGDSGGPLTVSEFLIGVVSWGLGCARPQYPGIYTRLSALTDWIEATIEELVSTKH